VDTRSFTASEGTFDAHYGLEILDYGEDEVRGQLVVQPHHKQGAGLLHGGVLASMAEALASLSTFVAVAPEGKAAMGMSNATTFMRPITEGTVHAVGRRRHRGRTTWVWDVDFTDDAGRLCATTRMTIAVRDLPG